MVRFLPIKCHECTASPENGVWMDRVAKLLYQEFDGEDPIGWGPSSNINYRWWQHKAIHIIRGLNG